LGIFFLLTFDFKTKALPSPPTRFFSAAKFSFLCRLSRDTFYFSSFRGVGQAFFYSQHQSIVHGQISRICNFLSSWLVLVAPFSFVLSADRTFSVFLVPESRLDCGALPTSFKSFLNQSTISPSMPSAFPPLFPMSFIPLPFSPRRALFRDAPLFSQTAADCGSR